MSKLHSLKFKIKWLIWWLEKLDPKVYRRKFTSPSKFVLHSLSNDWGCPYLNGFLMFERPVELVLIFSSKKHTCLIFQVCFPRIQHCRLLNSSHRTKMVWNLGAQELLLLCTLLNHLHNWVHRLECWGVIFPNTICSTAQDNSNIAFFSSRTLGELHPKFSIFDNNENGMRKALRRK